jgi:hypothetical protein
LGNIATQFCHTQAFAPVAVPFAAGGVKKMISCLLLFLGLAGRIRTQAILTNRPQKNVKTHPYTLFKDGY